MDRKLAHPGLGMAVVLALLFLGVQIVLSIPLEVVNIVFREALHRASPHLERNARVISFVNILAAAACIGLGVFWNKMPLKRACPASRIGFVEILGVLLVVLGGDLLLSDLDNVLRYFLPPPALFQDAMEEIMFSEGHLPSQVWLLVIVAPVTEELLFRGIILRGRLSRHRPWVAIFLTSLLFAVVHMNPWQFLPPLLLGLALGWFYVRTGSVPLCILAHALSNGMALFLPKLNVEIPGLTGMPGSGPVEFQPWWLDLSAAALLALGLLVFRAGTKPWREEVPPFLEPPVIGNA